VDKIICQCCEEKATEKMKFFKWIINLCKDCYNEYMTPYSIDDLSDPLLRW